MNIRGSPHVRLYRSPGSALPCCSGLVGMGAHPWRKGERSVEPSAFSARHPEGPDMNYCRIRLYMKSRRLTRRWRVPPPGSALPPARRRCAPFRHVSYSKTAYCGLCPGCCMRSGSDSRARRRRAASGETLASLRSASAIRSGATKIGAWAGAARFNVSLGLASADAVPAPPSISAVEPYAVPSRTGISG
jgi:hypothetical protein